MATAEQTKMLLPSGDEVAIPQLPAVVDETAALAIGLGVGAAAKILPYALRGGRAGYDLATIPGIFVDEVRQNPWGVPKGLAYYANMAWLSATVPWERGYAESQKRLRAWLADGNN